MVKRQEKMCCLSQHLEISLLIIPKHFLWCWHCPKVCILMLSTTGRSQYTTVPWTQALKYNFSYTKLPAAELSVKYVTLTHPYM